ncbi:MAG: hypothetical protein M3296_06335 [Actinomycetota bacterium]|nr:hypothetical protein [Actinomycetota bacterium]
MIGHYAKSRQILRAAGMLGLLGVMTAAWGEYELRLPNLRASSETVLYPIVLIVPAACAIVIGSTTRGWLGDIEVTAARPMRAWRLAHALGLCLLAAAILAPAASAGSHGYGSAVAVRNVLGYCGLVLLAAAVVGSELSWVPPLAFALPVPLLGVNAQHQIASWAWPLQPANVAMSWGWALAIAAIGVGVWVQRSSRPSPPSGVDQA